MTKTLVFEEYYTLLGIPSLAKYNFSWWKLSFSELLKLLRQIWNWPTILVKHIPLTCTTFASFPLTSILKLGKHFGCMGVSPSWVTLGRGRKIILKNLIISNLSQSFSLKSYFQGFIMNTYHFETFTLQQIKLI